MQYRTDPLLRFFSAFSKKYLLSPFFYYLVRAQSQIVAKVIEAQLGVGGVSNAARVRFPPRRIVQAAAHEPHCEAEQAVHLWGWVVIVWT